MMSVEADWSANTMQKRAVAIEHTTHKIDDCVSLANILKLLGCVAIILELLGCAGNILWLCSPKSR